MVFTIPNELYQELQKACQEEGRSVPKVLTELIRKYLKNSKRKRKARERKSVAE